ncbi:MAG: phosphoribosylformylglycinamidine synthase subunit PurQ [Patescibacteria group bacterium]|nr:phosphoribosylformylglycinamidine synthase subunit PurQ [Patescibacteria group bacterium]
MSKPKALVFAGYGLNSEEETSLAFDMAGGVGEIVHINDVIDGTKNLSDYQIFAIPGGFAYGDDTGAGNAYAQKMKNHLWEKLQKFVSEDKLIIGICNGFQVLVNLGLLPALEMKYGNRELGLMPNELPRYTVRFVDLRVDNPKSPWLRNIDIFSIPVSNGEGKLFATEENLKKMNKKQQVAVRYIKGPMCEYLNVPASPNGSIDDIAGVTNETGRVLGLMPHPERAMFFTQMPNWQVVKQDLLAQGKALPKYGPGFGIFENAITYFK